MERSEAGESYLTVAEVAETLKLNQQTVRNWIDAGYLTAFHVGRRVRIVRSDLEELLERSRIQSPSAAAASPSSETGQAFWDGDLPADRIDPSEDG